MSRISLLPAAARTVQPWKNGGGETTEIAANPAGAGIDAFDWRISTATVSKAGDFSRFDGIDRTLAVIEGRLRLSFDTATIELDAATSSFAFPGDVACLGTPLGKQVIDLNLMAWRGRYSGAIERVDAPGARLILPRTQHGVVIFVEGGSITWRSDAVTLQPWDAILVEEAIGEAIAVQSNGAVYIVSIVGP